MSGRWGWSCTKGFARLARQSRERLRGRKQSIQRVLGNVLFLVVQKVEQSWRGAKSGIEMVHMRDVIRWNIRTRRCCRGRRETRSRRGHGQREEEALVKACRLGSLLRACGTALLQSGLELTDHILEDAERLLEAKVASKLQLAEACPEEGDGLGELASLVTLLAKDDNDSRVDSIRQQEWRAAESKRLPISPDQLLDHQSTLDACLLTASLGALVGVPPKVTLLKERAV